jgi:agmatine/peptidylarginine deiminase
LKRLLVCAAVLGSVSCRALPVQQPTPEPTTFLARSSPVRVAAEWEATIGVLIAWPPQLPEALLVALAREVDLYVTVQGARDEYQAGRQFAALGIGRERVHYIHTVQGRHYYLTRDWGPFAAFDDAGNYWLVDGRFRAYPLGTADSHRLILFPRVGELRHRWADEAPRAVARVLGRPSVELPIALTGGSIAFDGQGTAFATQIVLDENREYGTSAEEFFAVACRELGVRRFHVVPNFERFGIQHLDCLMKLLDEERILVKRAPPDHPAFEPIERAADHLSRLISPSGRPYQVLRIDAPPFRLNRLANYTNALIVNRSIFVPLFGIPADADALATWQRAMPGYDVQGFESPLWSYTDALHCRVRGIWDPGMLHLTHQRPDAVVRWAESFPLELRVRDYSGAGPVPDQLNLIWRVRPGGAWKTVRLQPETGGHCYRAVIEGVRPGESVAYYFTAASRSGRRETLPRSAPGGVYSFTTVGASPVIGSGK